MYPVNTPADGGGDNSNFAANVGYVKTAIAKLLTGDGNLTIDKRGDVSIYGYNISLTGTGGGLTISKTGDVSITGNNVLQLHNTQGEAPGLAIRAVTTPNDSEGDNSNFAANVGYVKDAVNTVNSKLDTEISNRTAGDADLQSTIDGVIMPLINALQKRAPRVFYFSSTVNPGELSAADVPALKNALVDHTPIILVGYYMSDLYYFHISNCDTAPTAENINTDSFYIEFRTLDGRYMAHITLDGATGATVVTFDPVS